MSQTSTRPASSDWFGQPRGLSVLFLTEMWEVFSFFGMKTLLVYYMTEQLMMAQEQASLVYGLYSGLAYFTPIIGGVISDRWLGKRNCVIAGGVIMALGHFMLVFQPLFYPALATVAIGAGLYLPSLPSQIAALFSRDDPRKGSAYSVYYVGMNLGALLAPLVCGTLGELMGWHYGFGAAGVGMLIGVAIYGFGRRYLPPEERPAPRTRAVAAPVDQTALGRFGMIFAIATVVVLFRASYEQIGNTLALWLDQGVDRQAGGFTIPMTWFQSINPALVFGLTPILMIYWTRLAKRGREATPLMKMATGAVLLAVGYLLLAGATALSPGGRPSWLWFAAFVALMTAGELYLMPICLGVFNRLAPPAFAATGVAVWFMTGFGGNLLAGVLGSFWSRFSPPGFFLLMASVAGLAAMLLSLFDRPVRKAEALVEVGLSPTVAAEPAPSSL
jgi:POT family proton-dependent oligopeptide transporter